MAGVADSANPANAQQRRNKSAGRWLRSADCGLRIHEPQVPSAKDSKRQSERSGLGRWETPAIRIPQSASKTLACFSRWPDLNAPSDLSTMLVKFLGWLLIRVLAGALLVLLLLGALSYWRYRHDGGDFVRQRSARLADLKSQEQQVQASLEKVRKQREETSAEIDAEDARASQADRVIATLRDLASTWDRYVGNPAQQKANDEQMKRMEVLRDAARKKQADLKQDRTRLIWERDGLEISLQKVQDQLGSIDQEQSALMFYLADTWDRAGNGCIGFLIILFFVLLMFAPRPRAEED